MTEFDIKHGLAQCHPGPLEPVELFAVVPGVPVAAGWKLVPIEPTDAMVVEGVNAGLSHQDEPYFIYAAMLAAAPAAPSSALLCAARAVVAADDDQALTSQLINVLRAACDAQGDTYDSIALDKLADYIADNWPDKLYGLEEICQRLHATWPTAFMPAAGDARAWQGLTDAERDGYVGELVDYGTDFVVPLYSVVESIEKRLREKNAAQQGEGSAA